ncbi:MAG: hypothetical protein RL150_472 [Candidatus Parcubacteria bacterium]|jgi:prepilin-type N-terminal cleavage/methylation domain-containing protein
MPRLSEQKKSVRKGFTLIELMVAVSIFAIVLMMALGTVLTVLDANRKARTLTEVMNNLNFSLEAMTRSIKTGVDPTITGDANGAILKVTAIVLEEDGFSREDVEYQRRQDAEGRGYIATRVNDGAWVPITSEQVDVTDFTISTYGFEDCQSGSICHQPRTQIGITGNVEINDKISSTFSLQTTVSQRKLNLAGQEDTSGL